MQRTLQLLILFFLLLASCSPTSAGDGPEDKPKPDPTPAPNPGATVFAIIGDYGEYDQDSGDADEDVQAIATLMESWGTDFVLTLGDNEYNHNGASVRDFELSVGQHFQDYLDKNAFFPVPGDHDYGDNCPDEADLSSYLEFFNLPTGPEDETYYDFERGSVHFFALDSLVDCHRDGGAKLARQKAWLEQTAKASDAVFKIAYFHNPPYSSGERHGSSAYMQWPFKDWGISLVMSGDDHIYERIEKDGVVYIVNGLGGVEQHPAPSVQVEGSQKLYRDAFGAMRVDMTDTTLTLFFIDVNGETVDRFTLTAAAEPSSDWYKPAVNSTWQWQLQGTLNTSYDVDIYDIDLFDTDSSLITQLQNEGRKVICYFSAGSYEAWRPDAGEFATSDLGNTLDGFEDERWLDIRSENVRTIMKTRLELANQKGCDGVEPDNVDGYQNNPGFPLNAADQLSFNRFLAAEAHTLGLAIGLKNDLDQIPELVELFDFSVNEQCHEYNECEALKPFIDADKPVFNAEYKAAYRTNPAAICPASKALGLQTLILPLDLDDSFRISCSE